MSHPLPTEFKAAEQPVESIKDVAGFYFRSITLKHAGDIVPQHVHDYTHATIVCAGSVRAWADKRWLGDFNAFDAIEIAAGAEHVFLALEDGTRLACVHNLQGKQYEFLRETKLEGEPCSAQS